MTFRIPSLLALLASLSLCALPLFAEDDDAPPKTSAKKKSAAAAATAKKKALAEATADEDTTAASGKKKSTTTTGAKKKKPVESDDPAASTATVKKGSDLDLPLPKKPGTTKKSDSATAESKDSGAKTDEGKSTDSKSKDKDSKADETATSGTKPAADAEAAKHEHAPAATVEPEAIADFPKQPEHVQQVIRAAMDLTRQNLTYTFGSDDPAKGGMDCSGTIYYLLRANGFPNIPRDSSSQYLWARKSGAFFPVVSKSAESPEFSDLQPGDLMFWTGTYETGRDVPISHVMLYLGKEKGTGKRIMFGASDGRSYNGVQRWGVSVFDFKMPKADPANPEKAKVDFVGYARIPGLRGGPLTEVASATTDAKAAEVETKTHPSETAKPKAAATEDDTSDQPKKTPAKTSTTGTKKRKKPVSSD